jgi:SnoaL-like domain
MTDTTIDITSLADRYIAAWNEENPQARRRLVETVYTAEAAYADPMLKSEGHDGIETMIAAVQSTYPGFRFTRTSDVESHNDRIRFRWSLGPAGGEPIVDGTDFGVVVSGRIAEMVGFFDRAPKAA